MLDFDFRQVFATSLAQRMRMFWIQILEYSSIISWSNFLDEVEVWCQSKIPSFGVRPPNFCPSNPKISIITLSTNLHLLSFKLIEWIWVLQWSDKLKTVAAWWTIIIIMLADSQNSSFGIWLVQQKSRKSKETQVSKVG